LTVARRWRGEDGLGRLACGLSREIVRRARATPEPPRETGVTGNADCEALWSTRGAGQDSPTCWLAAPAPRALGLEGSGPVAVAVAVSAANETAVGAPQPVTGRPGRVGVEEKRRRVGATGDSWSCWWAGEHDPLRQLVERRRRLSSDWRRAGVGGAGGYRDWTTDATARPDRDRW